MKKSKLGYKRYSPDVNNPYNIIPSGRITMKDVDFPVYGVDNFGNEQIMYPGEEYQFPGSEVFELPMFQKAGQFDETTRQKVVNRAKEVIANKDFYHLSPEKAAAVRRNNDSPDENTCIGGVCRVLKDVGLMQDVIESNTDFVSRAVDLGFSRPSFDINALRPGDIIQHLGNFNDNNKVYPSHAQIYLGKDEDGNHLFFDNYRGTSQFWGKTGMRSYSDEVLLELLEKGQSGTIDGAQIIHINPNAAIDYETPEQRKNRENREAVRSRRLPVEVYKDQLYSGPEYFEEVVNTKDLPYTYGYREEASENEKELINLFNNSDFDKKLRETFKVSDQTLETLKPIIYGIMKQESNFGNPETIGRSLKYSLENLIGPDSISTGPAAVRYKNLRQPAKDLLGGNKNAIETIEGAYIGALDSLLSSGNISDAYLFNNPELLDKDPWASALYYYNGQGRSLKRGKTSAGEPLRVDEGSYPYKVFEGAQRLKRFIPFDADLSNPDVYQNPFEVLVTPNEKSADPLPKGQNGLEKPQPFIRPDFFTPAQIRQARIDVAQGKTPLTTEGEINLALGNPKGKAAALARKAAGPGKLPVDNIRHTSAGMYTADAIANKLAPYPMGPVTVPAKALGFIGSNLAGLAHEVKAFVPSLDGDYRNIPAAARMSAEDMINNFVGSVLSLNPFMTQEEKENFIIESSNRNLLPDGYEKLQGQTRDNAYVKKQYGGDLKEFGSGGLKQWFDENWVDVKTGEECGRSGKDKYGRPYPACRPSRRVNSTTPKTTSEMSSSEKARFKREKTSGKRIDYNHKRVQEGGQTSSDTYVDPEMMFRDKYNTELAASERKKFDKWVTKESKRQGRDILMDMGAYDVQGFWKSGDYKNMDEDNHGSDRWKKPNHPTFSNQSKYHGADGWYGGNWTKDGGYQPSKQTLETYGSEYYDWIFGLEPNRPEHLDMSRYESGINRPTPLYYKKGGSLYKAQKGGKNKLLYDPGSDTYYGPELEEVVVVGEKSKDYPYADQLDAQSRKYWRKNYGDKNNPILRGIKRRARVGDKSLYSDLQSIAEDVLITGAEYTSVPGALRFINDPVNNLKGAGQTFEKLLLGTNPMASSFINTEITPEQSEQFFNTVDVAGIAAAAGPVIKGVKAALPVVKGIAKKPIARVADDVISNAWKVNPRARQFKSEIDWAKWNKEIPENKALIQEYNAIEKELTKNNSFGINPATNAPYTRAVPKEIDVVLRSKNFKKSFPDFNIDNDAIYRGERYLRKNYINNERPADVIFGTSDFEGAHHYTKSQNPLGEIIHPDKIDEELREYGDNILEYTMPYNSGEVGGINVLAVPKTSKTLTVDANNSHFGAIPTHEKLNPQHVTNNTENIKYTIERYGKGDIKGLPSDYSKDKLYANTDSYASALNDGLKDYNRVLVKNVYDGIPRPIDVSIINPRNTPIKSIFHNSGMFDMTNPNIYKSLLPIGLGSGAAGAYNANQSKYQRGGQMSASAGYDSWYNSPMAAGRYTFNPKDPAEYYVEGYGTKQGPGIAVGMDYTNPKYRTQGMIRAGLDSEIGANLRAQGGYRFNPIDNRREQLTWGPYGSVRFQTEDYYEQRPGVLAYNNLQSDLTYGVNARYNKALANRGRFSIEGDLGMAMGTRPERNVGEGFDPIFYGAVKATYSPPMYKNTRNKNTGNRKPRPTTYSSGYQMGGSMTPQGLSPAFFTGMKNAAVDAFKSFMASPDASVPEQFGNVSAPVDWRKLSRPEQIKYGIDQVTALEAEANRKPLENLLEATAYMENRYGEDPRAYNRDYTSSFMSIDPIALKDMFTGRGAEGRYNSSQRRQFENFKKLNLPTDKKEFNTLLTQNDPVAAMAAARYKYALVPEALPDMNNPEAMFNYWLKYYNGNGVLKHQSKAQAFKDFQRAYQRALSND